MCVCVGEGVGLDIRIAIMATFVATVTRIFGSKGDGPKATRQPDGKSGQQRPVRPPPTSISFLVLTGVWPWLAKPTSGIGQRGNPSPACVQRLKG